MCGGIGSRFWPFSRQSRPKQFLDFFGTGRTMLQMTFDRIRPIVNPENVVIMTNMEYAGLVSEQLPEVPRENILTEPARRNTAPCICWAARHIYDRCPDASIVTLPADHLILKEDAFVRALEEGFSFVESNKALLTLGIKPTAPKTGYGYIQAGIPVESWPGIMKVKAFTEKPDEDLAKVFLQSGEFFWNAGIFLWTASTILDAFAVHAPEIESIFSRENPVFSSPDDERLYIRKEYPNATCISVDYAILEKSSDVYVKTVDVGWSDIGTWKALYEVSPHNSDNNVTQNCKVLARDCSGTIFAAPDDKLIVASGLKDYIVAENGNALLIFPINEEQKIRQIVNEITDSYGDKFI